MKKLLPMAGMLGLLALWTTPSYSDTAAAPAPYPAMAPLKQYLSASEAEEIALAKSAAPTTVAEHAEVMVLGEHGYTTAVKGNNGFVCLVFRSWDMSFDNPEFWNPKIRTPQCLNAPAAHTEMALPAYLTRTEWVLSGVSISEMKAREDAEWASGKFKAPAGDDVIFMLSKQQYINDNAHPWYPHVMFLAPQSERGQWGENLAGSPVVADCTNVAQTCIFMVLAPKWSDGTPSPYYTMSSGQTDQHHH